MDEINRKREINMLSDVKRLELLYAEKVRRARDEGICIFVPGRVLLLAYCKWSSRYCLVIYVLEALRRGGQECLHLGSLLIAFNRP